MNWMRGINRRISGKLTALMLTAGIATLVGCGTTEHSPVGINATDIEQSETAQPSAGFIVFSQQAAVRAGKWSSYNYWNSNNSNEESEYFSFYRSDSMTIELNDDSRSNSGISVSKATFSTRANSIDISDLRRSQRYEYVTRDACKITMEVTSGSVLEDVVVAFDPAGLKFSPFAALDIYLTGDCSKVLQSGKGYAYHISGDGHIEKVATEVEVYSSGAHIKVEVPGFSKYSWDY